MPSVKIASPTWLAILTKLGIVSFGTFELSNIVVPVAIVDTEVTLNAVAIQPTYASPASAGELVNPGAATRLADTGALSAGTFTFSIMWDSNVAMAVRVRRRNAADAADIWSQRIDTAASTAFVFPTFRSTLAQNERLVVETIGAIVGTAQGNIFAATG